MSTDLTGILSALVVVVLAAFGVVVGRRGARNRSGAGSRVAVPTAVDSPGSDGGTATIEVDPRTVRTLRLAYAPQRDGQPDAGEVVWTWVPYAERDGRGKDRPVLVIARQTPDRFYAVKLTSVSHDGDRDFLSLGSGPWDAQGRESWVDVDQLYSVHAGGVRREAAALDRARFERVAGVLQKRFGWSAP
ncbi:type II toxin-antitoxin system PemK/MazF family toxin [uncultured Microbacterium sp.]|uniref:type II toxin-antitoxin system PemK/MazF family toxin n=1 Tax=uncultured Microbacterium sp. TaxID=191216 RepID=UPI0025F020F1|nr:type II toxin-antitoxin system PemK/MazF family toxin [uncultured Microbacterium sp.]